MLDTEHVANFRARHPGRYGWELTELSDHEIAMWHARSERTQWGHVQGWQRRNAHALAVAAQCRRALVEGRRLVASVLR